MNININDATYIYTKPIKVTFTNDSIIKYITFSSTMPSDIESTNNMLFSTTTIDKEFIGKFTTTTKDNIEYIKVTNLSIFKITPLLNVKYMICFIMKLNVRDINIKIINSNYVVKTDKSKKQYYVHDDAIPQINEFESGTSIGDAEIEVTTVNQNSSDYTNYETYFYSQWLLQAQYIKKLLTQDIKSIKITPWIKNVTVSLIYNNVDKEFSNINIAKLFNMLHISNVFRKIIAHSDTFDTYTSTEKNQQYAKYPIYTSNPFKSTVSRFNTVSIYTGVEIIASLILTRIEVHSFNSIDCIFTITNSNITTEIIERELSTYFDEKGAFWNLFKKIHINECIMDLNYKYENYIPIYNGIDVNILYSGVRSSDIEKLSLIINQEIPSLRYKTKTSISLSNYALATTGAIYRFMYLINFHEFITLITMQKSYTPVTHVSMYSNNTISISCINAFSFSDVVSAVTLFIPLFKHNNNAVNSIEDNGEMTVDSIRKKWVRIDGKKLLKQLEEIDPVLFGIRQVGSKKRPYSGLAQKQEQRVVPITEEEFDFLKDKIPNSVVDIKNQHNPSQRLCLLCPHKEYPFLNFHYFNGQLCVPKCTIKHANISQYNFCSVQLDSSNKVTFNNKFENQTITLYNPLITPGRKCKVPPEFGDVLINYILLKLNINLSIYTYIENVYKKQPFIIKRNIQNETYDILTEYDKNTDYILILQSELDDKYFIFIDNNNGDPLTFSENEEIKNFMKINGSKTKIQYNFFNYIEKLIKSPISEYYDNTITEILNILIAKFNIKYIIYGNFIYGILYKNTAYLTPKLYWNFKDNESINVIKIFSVIESTIGGIFKFPNIKDLDIDAIDLLYVDYESNKIAMIDYYGSQMLVEPFDITEKYTNMHMILFDNKAILANYLNINFDKKNINNENEILQLNVEQIINSYIFIYINTVDSIKFEEIEKLLTDYKILIEEKSYITYTPGLSYISWRSSKISKRDFDNYVNRYIDKGFTQRELITIIYKQFQDELKFKVLPNIEQFKSKIITI